MNKAYSLKTSLLKKNRYVYDKQTNNIIDEIVNYFPKRTKEIDKSSILYRAQVGCEYNEEGLPFPFPEERMLPRQNKAREGRANPKGISYIYLANSIETALCEVRCWPGDHISLATIELKNTLNFIDFSIDKKKDIKINLTKLEITPNNTIEGIWGTLNSMFSEPVRNSDDTAEYALTQMITEHVKNKGYDGIIYNSGYRSQKNSGKNYVIFDKKNIIIKKLSIYSIDNISVKFSEANSPLHI